MTEVKKLLPCYHFRSFSGGVDTASSISSIVTSFSTADVTKQTENNGAKAVGTIGMIAIGAAALLP